MQVPAKVKPLIRIAMPPSLRRRFHGILVRLAPLYPKLGVKARSELHFWQELIDNHGAEPQAEYYQRFMLAMGDLDSPEFFRNKICIDIGCGPKGSLTWLDGIAKAAVGVDPLIEQYMRFGIAKHPMIYLKSGAESLPFPAGYADVIFSMNSLDHVDDVGKCCREIRRVLKPDGYFIGSLNLDEPPTLTEPWTLTEEFLEDHLFRGWEQEFLRICPRIDSEEGWGPYRYMFEQCPVDISQKGGPRALWCRYRKPI
jgi:SAM-dependent methyltransferase